jgi:hypothetical protein
MPTDVPVGIDGGGRGQCQGIRQGTGAAYTENGTWGAGVGHFHTWDGDRYRYLGGIAKVNANLDYFGLLNGSALWHAGRTFAGMVRPVRAVQLWRPHGVPVGPGSVAAAGAQ